MQEFGDILATCRLFEGVSTLPSIEPGRTRLVKKNERIMVAGDRCDELLVVLKGRLGLVFDRGWGKERMIEILEPGDMAGDVELLNGERIITDVRALDDCILLPVSRPEFERLLAANPHNWTRISAQARSRSCRRLITRHVCDLFGIAGIHFSDPMIRARAEQEWLEFENIHLATRSYK